MENEPLGYFSLFSLFPFLYCEGTAGGGWQSLPPGQGRQSCCLFWLLSPWQELESISVLCSGAVSIPHHCPPGPSPIPAPVPCGCWEQCPAVLQMHLVSVRAAVVASGVGGEVGRCSQVCSESPEGSSTHSSCWRREPCSLGGVQDPR